MASFNCQLATPRFTWNVCEGLSRLSWPVGVLSVWEEALISLVDVRRPRLKVGSTIPWVWELDYV